MSPGVFPAAHIVGGMFSGTNQLVSCRHHRHPPSARLKAPPKVGLFSDCRFQTLSSESHAQFDRGMIFVVDLREIRRRLRRTPWNDFPPVVILADVPAAKGHPLFSDAKAGDAKAAESVVEDTLAGVTIEPLRVLIGNARPHLLAVHAVEEAGMNAIPRTFARALSLRLDLPLKSGIIQLNRVGHTGATGYHRLAFPPVFDGAVDPVDYLLVDDFVGQGGTLANLRGYLESNAGRVVGSVTLTGKAYSAELRLKHETVAILREKHGQQFEEWWVATFGYSFDRLTESEARYLIRSDDADTASARIVAARGDGD